MVPRPTLAIHSIGRRKEASTLTALGILLLVVTLLLAVGIGTLANRNVRSFDESAHENLVGSASQR